MVVLIPGIPIDGVIYRRDRKVERNLGAVSDVVGVAGNGWTIVAPMDLAIRLGLDVP